MPSKSLQFLYLISNGTTKGRWVGAGPQINPVRSIVEKSRKVRRTSTYLSDFFQVTQSAIYGVCTHYTLQFLHLVLCNIISAWQTVLRGSLTMNILFACSTGSSSVNLLRHRLSLFWRKTLGNGSTFKSLCNMYDDDAYYHNAWTNKTNTVSWKASQVSNFKSSGTLNPPLSRLYSTNRSWSLAGSTWESAVSTELARDCREERCVATKDCECRRIIVKEEIRCACMDSAL